MENLIEELTKVNPANLSEEGLKLFNTIMLVIDDRDKLIKENKKLNNANKTYINCIQNITPVLTTDYIEKSLIKEKIEELNTMIIETHRGNLQRYTVSEILSFLRFCEELLKGE